MKERNTPRRPGLGRKVNGHETTQGATGPSSAEELYRKIFEHSNDGIFVIDPEHDNIVDVNPKLKPKWDLHGRRDKN